MDKRQFSKNKTLFLAAVIATILQVAWLILEMFGHQRVLFEMTAVYLLILITYATHNRILKWGEVPYKTRKGEFFVYFFWIFTFFIYTLYIFNVIIKIPDQLSITFSGVTVVFFGTEIIKLVGNMLRKKWKKTFIHNIIKKQQSTAVVGILLKPVQPNRKWRWKFVVPAILFIPEKAKWLTLPAG